MNPKTDLYKHLHPGAEQLKVLHIGNIANNGYNIANLFNQAGVESDLIIGPYYHIAGCPEWEDAEFIGEIGDQFRPAWHNVTIVNDFQRPRWAAQGPWELCIKYLLHKNRGNSVRQRLYWHWLKICQRASSSPVERKIPIATAIGSPKKILAKLTAYSMVIFQNLKILLARLAWHLGNNIYVALWHLRNFFHRVKNHVIRHSALSLKFLLKSNRFTLPMFYKLRNINRQRMKRYRAARTQGAESEVDLEVDSNQLFETEEDIKEKLFEDAPIIDGFDPGELASHQALALQLQPLFEYYDLIVGYSTDGIWPLLADKKYVAYEHGTLRSLPFEESLSGRICKLVYQNANAVIVSNFDNNLAAEKLELKDYTCIPHYINEMEVDKKEGEKIRKEYQTKFATDFIVYNPSRQHWSNKQDVGWEKGNDIFIRGFAEFVHKINPNAMTIMTHWGESLPESKQLIEELGIVKNVDWVEPVPHKKMIQYVQAADVVSDQFLLETFGGIPAKAFMHKRPVLSSFNPKIHEWCFDVMPPFLLAKTVTEIVNSLSSCYLDKGFYNKVALDSEHWYYNSHSNRVLLEKMSKILVKVTDTH